MKSCRWYGDSVLRRMSWVLSSLSFGPTRIPDTPPYKTLPQCYGNVSMASRSRRAGITEENYLNPGHDR